jgi:hypothetical protein
MSMKFSPPAAAAAADTAVVKQCTCSFSTQLINGSCTAPSCIDCIDIGFHAGSHTSMLHVCKRSESQPPALSIAAASTACSCHGPSLLLPCCRCGAAHR